uniref:palmitoyl-protein hydrolase n=1 Tax=Cyprinus carpio carpio TaxID=630221 RepID=A0A9J8CZ32_CYPCA
MCDSISQESYKISQDCPEHLESIDSMCDHLSAIVKKGIQAGIPKHRIVIVWLLAYLSPPHPSISPYLIAFLCLTHSHTPLCHGTADELVFHSWGEETNSLLKKAGLNVSFHSFPDLNHQLCRQELELLRSWTLKKLSL